MLNEQTKQKKKKLINIFPLFFAHNAKCNFAYIVKLVSALVSMSLLHAYKRAIERDTRPAVELSFHAKDVKRQK